MLQSEYTMKPHQEPLLGYPPKEVMFSIIKWLLLSKFQLKILGLSNMQRGCIGRKYDWKIFRSESKCWHLGCLGPAHQTIVRPGPSSYCWDCLLHSLSIRNKIYIYDNGAHNYYQTINHQVIAGVGCYIPSVSTTNVHSWRWGTQLLLSSWFEQSTELLGPCISLILLFSEECTYYSYPLLLLKSNANWYICFFYYYVTSSVEIEFQNPTLSHKKMQPPL